MSIEEHQSQTELKTAISLLYGAFSYILPWTPYAVASLIGQFGPLDGDGQVRWISPFYVTIAAFFAKTAFLFNPLVYGFLDHQLRTSVHQMFRG